MDSAYRSDLQVGGLGFEINNLESGFNSCGVLKLLDIFSIKLLDIFSIKLLDIFSIKLLDN